MTIYNWAEIPAEVKWVATDCVGIAFGYEEKPTLDSDEEDWGGDPIKCIHGFWDNPFRGDWRESLEQRPEGV